MGYWKTQCNNCHCSYDWGEQKPNDMDCYKCKQPIPSKQWEYDSRTSEELRKGLLNNTFYCPVCHSIHSKGGEDLTGQVCFPHPGKYHCEGILRKVTEEELFGRKLEE